MRSCDGSKVQNYRSCDYFGYIWSSDNEEENKPSAPSPQSLVPENTVSVETDLDRLTLLTSDIKGVIGDDSRICTPGNKVVARTDSLMKSKTPTPSRHKLESSQPLEVFRRKRGFSQVGSVYRRSVRSNI